MIIGLNSNPQINEIKSIIQQNILQGLVVKEDTPQEPGSWTKQF